MFTTTIIDDLHELTTEIQSLINELNEITQQQDSVEKLISHLK